MAYIFTLRNRKNISIDWMHFRMGVYTTNDPEEAERIRKHPWFGKDIFEVPLKNVKSKAAAEKKEGEKEKSKEMKTPKPRGRKKINGNVGGTGKK